MITFIRNDAIYNVNYKNDFCSKIDSDGLAFIEFGELPDEIKNKVLKEVI